MLPTVTSQTRHWGYITLGFGWLTLIGVTLTQPPPPPAPPRRRAVQKTSINMDIITEGAVGGAEMDFCLERFMAGPHHAQLRESLTMTKCATPLSVT
jgi:hypothetical protein